MMFNAIEHEQQKELEETLNNADTSEIASSKSILDTSYFYVEARKRYVFHGWR